MNGANSLTFGIMVFGCFIFSLLSNRFGVKKILIIGTLGYAPYSAALYVNNRYGVEWFVLFGGATCGIAASALWASEGAIALGYGGVKDRGKFSMWLPPWHNMRLSLTVLSACSWNLARSSRARSAYRCIHPAVTQRR